MNSASYNERTPMINKKYYLTTLLFTTFIAQCISPAPIPGASYYVHENQTTTFYTKDDRVLAILNCIGIKKSEDLLDPTAKKLPPLRSVAYTKTMHLKKLDIIIFYDIEDTPVIGYSYNASSDTVNCITSQDCIKLLAQQVLKQML
jgi:hypothetical protein